MSYKLKVYVDHGYFEYQVSDMSSAIEHGQIIMQSGVYRRSRPDGDVEFHRALKVKVSGPDLDSEYLDIFRRT